jgi:hypothetical protein
MNSHLSVFFITNFLTEIKSKVQYILNLTKDTVVLKNVKLCESGYKI